MRAAGGAPSPVQHRGDSCERHVLGLWCPGPQACPPQCPCEQEELARGRRYEGGYACLQAPDSLTRGSTALPPLTSRWPLSQALPLPHHASSGTAHPGLG